MSSRTLFCFRYVWWCYYLQTILIQRPPDGQYQNCGVMSGTGNSKGSQSFTNSKLHTLIQLIETLHSHFLSRKGFLTLGNVFRSPGSSVVFLSHSPNRYNMISYLFTNRLSHLNLIEVKNVTISQRNFD